MSGRDLTIIYLIVTYALQIVHLYFESLNTARDHVSSGCIYLHPFFSSSYFAGLITFSLTDISVSDEEVK